MIFSTAKVSPRQPSRKVCANAHGYHRVPWSVLLFSPPQYHQIKPPNLIPPYPHRVWSTSRGILPSKTQSTLLLGGVGYFEKAIRKSHLGFPGERARTTAPGIGPKGERPAAPCTVRSRWSSVEFRASSPIVSHFWPGGGGGGGLLAWSSAARPCARGTAPGRANGPAGHHWPEAPPQKHRRAAFIFVHYTYISPKNTQNNAKTAQKRENPYKIAKIIHISKLKI